jgi:hypothetical protein
MQRIELNREQHERLITAWRDDAQTEQACIHATPEKLCGPDVCEIVPRGNFHRTALLILQSRGMVPQKPVEFRLQLEPSPDGPRYFLALEVP